MLRSQPKNGSAFLSTSPLRGTTSSPSSSLPNKEISIHVPLAGADAQAAQADQAAGRFLSTSPLRGTTKWHGTTPRRVCAFLSTAPLRGTTHRLLPNARRPGISIHVPLAGDDVRKGNRTPAPSLISIHVPLAGDDRNALQVQRHTCPFLSTSPLRGTTFYSASCLLLLWISIHVPLAGDDLIIKVRRCHDDYFYPRPPCGGRRTAFRVILIKIEFLSTSPLRGTTINLNKNRRKTKYFYPRPPCGGRRQPDAPTQKELEISIHVPLAGDDAFVSVVFGVLDISIHVPLAGDDTARSGLRKVGLHFYPRPPCGGRQIVGKEVVISDIFLSTSPLRGTT